MSLKAKLTALMLVMVTLTVAAVGTLSVTRSRSLLLQGIDESAHNKVDALVSDVEGLLSGLGLLADTFSHSTAVRSLNQPDMEKEIEAIMTRNPSLSALYAGVEQTGKLNVMVREGEQVKLWTTPADYDPRVRDWYKQAKSSGKLIFSPPYQDTATKEWIITVAVPFQNPQGTFAGVVGADVQLKDLTDFVASQKFGESGFALLIDAAGTILAHPDKSLLARKLTELPGQVADIGQHMIAGKEGSESYTYEAVDKEMFYRPVPMVGWSVGVIIDAEEIQAPVRQLINEVGLVGVIALLLTALAVLLLARGIARPIQQVGRQLESISKGGGDLTQRLAVASRDEVGMLGAWFNAFMDQLSAIVGNVATSARDVDERAAQLSDAVQQQAEVTNQLASVVATVAQSAQEQNGIVLATQDAMTGMEGAMKEIAGGAADQLQTVVRTRALSEQMADGVSQAVRDVQELSQAARDNADSAARGHDAVKAVVSSMETLRHGMAGTRANVATLDEGSRQIGAIVEVITAMAEQTNLLALNAAIEAARAGEHGRGFAVVAQEVRTLAEKSQRSTGEITAIIQRLSAAIETTVRSVEAAGRQVDNGSRLAEEAGRYLATIAEGAAAAGERTQSLLNVTGNLNARSQAVGTAMADLAAVAERTTRLVEQMEGYSQEVIQAIARIADISQSNAAGAEEGAASAEELSAALEEMAATASFLATSAQGLQRLVAQFKTQ